MIITSSNIVMQSSHLLQEYTTREERLQFWVGNRGSRPGFPPTRLDPSPALLGDIVDQLDLSSEARCIQALSTEEAGDDLELTRRKLKISLIESMLNFSAAKVRLKFPNYPSKNYLNFLSLPRFRTNLLRQAGIAYDFRETRFEHEQVSFQAAGQVQTADGKTINISIQLSMSRTLQSQSISIRAGDAVLTDPLVVNFDGPAAALTERNFQFDWI